MSIATFPPMHAPTVNKGRARPLVMVVDDQPANIQVLFAVLSKEFDVCMALNGEDALRVCHESRPDLILLDVVMPGMDGYALCRHLKADQATREIPVIFVTGSLDCEQEVRGFAEGGLDFITKPFHASVVLVRVRTQLTLKIQTDLLRFLSLTDSLTGVANRRQFDLTLVSESQRLRRTGEPLALLMIDVDYFKRYNDHYGHPLGDTCLQSIAACLSRSLLRSHDLVARYGGEEFACILPETPLVGALSKAAAMERAVRSLAIPHPASEVASVVTISVGVALSDAAAPEDPWALVRIADEQLYLAKNAGRGRVCPPPDFAKDTTSKR